MRSTKRGRATLRAEITNVSPTGVWLLLGERELFLAFKEFPWFENASIRDVSNVELHGADHLRWPALDVDLSVESIEHPDRYPLVSRLVAAQVRETSSSPSGKPSRRHLRKPRSSK